MALFRHSLARLKSPLIWASCANKKYGTAANGLTTNALRHINSARSNSPRSACARASLSNTSSVWVAGVGVWGVGGVACTVAGGTLVAILTEGRTTGGARHALVVTLRVGGDTGRAMTG